MKMSRAAARSTGANRTRRRGTRVRPKSTTRSSAITSPRSGSKCGSKYSRVTSSRAARSTHCGRIRAATWAYTADVSTSSAATIQCTPDGFTAEPGDSTKIRSRGPRYSRPCDRTPTCATWPASTARWTWA